MIMTAKDILISPQLICINIGHGHPKVAEAVARQMSEISYVYPGMVTAARVTSVKAGGNRTGDLNKAFFTLGGAEAIENAIKLARVYTGRHKLFLSISHITEQLTHLHLQAETPEDMQ